MPRRVTVSDVRRELYWAAGGPAGAGAGAAADGLTGTLFHAVFAGLTGGAPHGLVRPLEDADAGLPAWQAALTEHAYAWHLGPALAREHERLHAHAQQVLDLWSAVRALSAWLAELMWAQHRAGRDRTLESVRQAIFQGHEVAVETELREPGWSDAVLLTGRLDALLCHPTSGATCIIELKLGRGAPEADLGQAALYHLLSGAARRPVEQVVVLSFEPEPRELRFDAPRLAEAQGALVALIGRLAGVSGAPDAAGETLPSFITLAPPPSRPSESASTPPAVTSPPHALPPAPTPPAIPATVSPTPVTPPAVTGPFAPGPYDDLRRRLEAAFNEFDVPLRVDARPLVGPTFVRFSAEPGRGVRLNQVLQLAPSVWTRLHTDQAPYISVVGGRLAIDVQRPDRQTVFWRDLRSELPAPGPVGCSRFPVGQAVDGKLLWADLAAPDNCHFLVAGTSGSGKSEWLRAVLASLLAANTPDTLRLLLVDPKRTAFHAFEGAACLWRPVVYPSDVDFVGVLDELVDEMEQRYLHLAHAQVTDLGAYNARAERPLPRVVCVCDEYADLVADRHARRDLEIRVARLGAKARAAGIHLIFATQRPSRDIVQGTLSANLVARVALRVVSPLESRLILNVPDAAALLGRGDLLFRGVGDPLRLQSPYIEEHELRALTPRA